ncbi:MAG: acyltransferase family protein [Bacteroidota bacterium]
MESITKRRHDIDWLRVIAIGLLLIYHIAIIFQPWGVLIGFVQSSEPMESLWIPMGMLNVWRIPLLFFVSGMGVCFAIKKRSWKQLIGERAKRILIPFLFGIACIVPLHILIWQSYYNQDLSYYPNPAHLWFLGNIFSYVLLLSPLFFYLVKREDSIIDRWLKEMYKHPLGLIPLMLVFILEVMLVRPEPYELYAMTWHGFFLGLIAFFFGFTFILYGNSFWPTVLKWRWLFLGMGLALYVTRFVYFEFEAPGYLTSIESNMWIFAVFGFGYKYLNRSNKALSYLSQAAYPIYIIHMAFLYLGGYFILPLSVGVFLKFILIVVFTFAGCFITYELIIRRVNFLRPLFGLKLKNKVNKKAVQINQEVSAA